MIIIMHALLTPVYREGIMLHWHGAGGAPRFIIVVMSVMIMFALSSIVHIYREVCKENKHNLKTWLLADTQKRSKSTCIYKGHFSFLFVEG